jgi:hypothetical protein
VDLARSRSRAAAAGPRGLDARQQARQSSASSAAQARQPARCASRILPVLLLKPAERVGADVSVLAHADTPRSARTSRIARSA